METMIANYVNGNLSDARRQARRFSRLAIFAALRETTGYSVKKANLVARYLKTGRGWQESCDAI